MTHAIFDYITEHPISKCTEEDGEHVPRARQPLVRGVRVTQRKAMTTTSSLPLIAAP
jgi:hypothetical protein